MESRAFIAAAAELVKDIKEFRDAALSDADAATQGNAIQRRIDAAFSGHFNPTLMAADELCRTATTVGFQVNPAVISRIHQHDSCWPRI